MGLLSRASILDENEIKPGLAFSDFITKHSLKTCAMLEQVDSNYCIKHSIGFDSLSILSTLATVDFWNGICKEGQKIYKFSESERSPFLQLFSETIKYNFKEIFVYKSQGSHILLSLNPITDIIAQDFELLDDGIHCVNVFSLNPQIKENSTVLQFTLDLSEAIDSFLSAELKSNDSLKKLAAASITDEIYNRFSNYYNSPDTVIKSENGIIKTVFITGKAYSVELITNHLILNLKEVLGNYAELIMVEYCGTADSCEQIKKFLQVE